MSRFRIASQAWLSGLLLAIISISALADDTVTTQTVTTTPTGDRQVIITTTPAPKVVVAPPAGSTSCFAVTAGWVNDIWVPEHQVCQYTNSQEGAAWVEGYWACSKYKLGDCTNWDWKAGHWVSTFTPY